MGDQPSLGIWEIIQMLDGFGSIERLAAEPQLDERQTRLAVAYRDSCPEEIADRRARARRQGSHRGRGPGAARAPDAPDAPDAPPGRRRARAPPPSRLGPIRGTVRVYVLGIDRGGAAGGARA
jgi:hypothetical protein